jgi:hypothetical protein
MARRSRDDWRFFLQNPCWEIGWPVFEPGRSTTSLLRTDHAYLRFCRLRADAAACYRERRGYRCQHQGTVLDGGNGEVPF